MPGRSDQVRILAPTALTSLLLLAVAAAAGVALYRQQTDTAAELGENIGSRRAATNLEETLRDLIALHRDGVERVEPMHARIADLLRDIDAFADKPREKQLAARLGASYDRYHATWRAGGATAAARALLESETLPVCQEL